MKSHQFLCFHTWRKASMLENMLYLLFDSLLHTQHATSMSNPISINYIHTWCEEHLHSLLLIAHKQICKFTINIIIMQISERDLCPGLCLSYQPLYFFVAICTQSTNTTTMSVHPGLHQGMNMLSIVLGSIQRLKRRRRRARRVWCTNTWRQK